MEKQLGQVLRCFECISPYPPSCKDSNSARRNPFHTRLRQFSHWLLSETPRNDMRCQGRWSNTTEVGNSLIIRDGFKCQEARLHSWSAPYGSEAACLVKYPCVHLKPMPAALFLTKTSTVRVGCWLLVVGCWLLVGLESRVRPGPPLNTIQPDGAR